METCYLVDYENVKEKGLTGCLNLTARDSICIFYTENAKNVSWDIFCNHGEAALTVKKVPTGDQSLDKHLVAWLGYLLGTGKAQETDFVIVSKDTGFDRIIRFWKTETGITVKRCAQIEDYEKQLRQRASAAAPAQSTEPPADSLAGEMPGSEEAHRAEQPEEETRKPQPKNAGRRAEQAAEVSAEEPQGALLVKTVQNAEASADEPSAEETTKSVLPDGQIPQEQLQNESVRNGQTPKNSPRNNRRQRMPQNKYEARRKTSLNSEVQQVLARARLPFHNGEINATAKVVSRFYRKEEALSLIHNELRRLYPEEYQDIYALVKPIIERYRKEQKENAQELAAEADGTENIRETETAAKPDGTEKTEPVREPETAAEPETAQEPEIAAEPEAAAEPETAQEPEATRKPETAAEPEAGQKPETAAEPETAQEPEAMRKPETAAEPETEPEPETMPEPETAQALKTAREPETAQAPETAGKPEILQEPEPEIMSEPEAAAQSETSEAAGAEEIGRILAEADYPQEIVAFVAQMIRSLRDGQIGKMQVYRNILQKYGRTEGLRVYRNIRELL